MVARRLLVVLLVLLGISSLLAIASRQVRDEDQTETTPAPPEPPPIEGSAGGALFRVKINADTPKIDAVGTGEIPLHVGDQVALRVISSRSDQVEIPAFGLIAAVARDAPASFDLLLERAGSYAIRLVEADRIVGRLAVTREAPPERGSGSGTDLP